jgi:hypothetical protein
MCIRVLAEILRVSDFALSVCKVSLF